MAKNRLNRLDVTCKEPGHTDEHRDRRHETSHDTCDPHSEIRHRERWAQFEMKEEQQRSLSEKIVECVISAEKDAQANKKTGHENSSGRRFFDHLDRNQNSAKQKCVIEKFVRREHPECEH